RRDTGELGHAHHDGGIFLVRDVVADGDRLEPLRGRQLLVDPVNFVGRKLEDPGKRGNDPWGVGQLLRNDVDPEARAVDGDRLAIAVYDPAPAWRDRNQLDPVAFGKQLVMLVLADGEIAKTADE